MCDNTPFLSIIVPVFNRAQLVRECIASVITQQEEDWELILVDDSSTNEICNLCI